MIYVLVSFTSFHRLPPAPWDKICVKRKPFQFVVCVLLLIVSVLFFTLFFVTLYVCCLVFIVIVCFRVCLFTLVC